MPSNAQRVAQLDFAAAKRSAKERGIQGERCLLFFQHLDRMRNAWVAYHAGASWMADPDAEKWPRYAGKLFSDLTRAESNVRRLTAEVERWQVRTDDVRKLVVAKRIETERLRGQLAGARAEVERLRSAVLLAAEKCEFKRPVSAIRILRDALAREDGAG